MFLRGDQISGEYAGASLLDDDGWFPTRDRGYVDEDGYLFVEGRADDTIIRGGENIAPAEIEDVLHATTRGGRRRGGGGARRGVGPAAGGAWSCAGRGRRGGRGRAARAGPGPQLRSSKTPEHIEFWDELPRTDTGKLLRRTVVARLGAEGTAAPD